MNLKLCASRCPGGQLGLGAKLKAAIKPLFTHCNNASKRQKRKAGSPVLHFSPQNGIRRGLMDAAQMERMP